MKADVLEDDVLGRAERNLVAEASRGCPFAVGAAVMHRVRSGGLNCARLRRSPADRLLVKGSAAKGRVLAGLESTEFIRRSGSLNPVKPRTFSRAIPPVFLVAVVLALIRLDPTAYPKYVATNLPTAEAFARRSSPIFDYHQSGRIARIPYPALTFPQLNKTPRYL